MRHDLLSGLAPFQSDIIALSLGMLANKLDQAGVEGNPDRK
jgi:hypothetical protein